MKNKFAWLLLILLLTSCSSNTFKKSDSSGFYGGDSGPTKDKRKIDNIPDAIPKHEPLSRTGNKTYSALGKTFRPLKTAKGYVKRGTASWYGKKFHGRRTSSGEIYDMWGMTAAHPILPLPTYVEVTNLNTGKKIIVKVNDRGPFLHDRIIDLSYAAAHKLRIANSGTGLVEVRALDPDDYIESNEYIKTGPVIGSIGTTNDTEQKFVAGEILIQIGAYSNIDNARSMRNLILQKGYAIYPSSEQENMAQGIPYKVQVGPFQTVNSAMKIKRTLEQILGQALFLVSK